MIDHSQRKNFDFDYLVQHDRVHSDVFTDPEIFDEEIHRVFSSSWIYAAHESEVPKPGDFKAITLGKTPVIVTRGDDNEIRVLVNRCRHRGAQVCEVPYGNTRYFRCWYHGWTYKNSGELKSVPAIDGYDDEFDKNENGLAEVSKVDSYRGFVFVSFSSSVPELPEFLGRTRDFIRILTDYSPTGRIIIRPGVVHKVRYQGNWKQVGMDGYHVHSVHASIVSLFSKRDETTGSAVGALEIEDPWSDNSLSRTRGFPYGHSALDLREQRRPHAEFFLKKMTASPGGAEYVKSMIDVHGQKRAVEIIGFHGDPHLGIFPNLQMIHDHIRVVVPVSVDQTEVHMYPIFLEGVPDEFNAARLRHHEDFYGPSSFGSPDDMELFERTQAGLAAKVNPWIFLGRGLKRDVLDDDGIHTGLISDEVTQRAQLSEWKRLMKVSI